MTGIQKRHGKYRPHITVNRQLMWLGVFDALNEAIRIRNAAAIKYHGDKAKIIGRELTIYEEKVYRLVSPDFMNLPSVEAAMIMGKHARSIQCTLVGIKKKCPSLFPLRMFKPKKVLRYKSWMDSKVVIKF